MSLAALAEFVMSRATPLIAEDITSRVLMDRIASEMERMIGAALP